MKYVLGVLTLLAGAGLPATAQEPAKKKDDLLQLKGTDKHLAGQVLKIDADVVEFLVNGEKQPRRIPLRDVEPYSIYTVKLDRADKTSGAAHFELAEWCQAQGLYPEAARQFERAGQLDAGL